MALTPLQHESELLQKIASGCSRSFTTLFYGYFDQVSGFVRSLTNCPDLTEEIVQEVFSKLWEDRSSLSGVKRFDAYLFIMTRNRAISAIRQANSHQKKLTELRYLVDESQAPQVFDEAEPDYEALIDRAVLQLPHRQQEVFTMRRKGFKNPEIALKLDISGSSVIKYQQLALKAVSKFVQMHILNLIITLLFLF